MEKKQQNILQKGTSIPPIIKLQVNSSVTWLRQQHSKGVFNHPNQLYNFSKNWGMQHSKTEFHEFHRPTWPHFSYSRYEIHLAIIPTMFIGKQVKFLEISLDWRE